MKIIVAHPGKQHSHLLVECLSSLGYETVLCASFAANENVFKSNFFYTKCKNILKKRILSSPIAIKKWVWLELLRIAALKICGNKQELVQFQFERIFDRLVSNWLKKQEFDVFIGYEVSCVRSMEVAQKKGKTTILDLAQIHFSEIEKLAYQYPQLSGLRESNLRKKINHVKSQELKIADHIWAISDFVKQSLISNGINSTKVQLVHIGSRENNIEEKEIASIPSTLNLLYVGSIRKQKGIDTLLTCMRQLRSNTKIRLTLVGGIDDEELSAEINISPNIQYLGYVHHSELNKYYREADIFILDSLLDSWGMVVIESMSVGTPVIVSENTGAKEAVRNGGGLIIAPNNPLELKSSILRYLEEENFLAIKSKEAKEISRQYNMQNYKRELSAALSILR